jgi:hypothetical protein
MPLSACLLAQGMDDWTTASTYTYAVSMSDMRLITPLWVYVYDANMTTTATPGGLLDGYQHRVGQLNVSDGRQPAALKRVWVDHAANASQVLDGAALLVGTRIRLVAVGQDPLGRPLQYMFWVSRDCSMGPQQEWNSSSSFNYTLMLEDMTPCTRLNAAVKNDDGWGHYDGTPDGFDDWVSCSDGCLCNKAEPQWCCSSSSMVSVIECTRLSLLQVLLATHAAVDA